LYFPEVRAREIHKKAGVPKSRNPAELSWSPGSDSPVAGCRNLVRSGKGRSPYPAGDLKIFTLLLLMPDDRPEVAGSVQVFSLPGLVICKKGCFIW